MPNWFEHYRVVTEEGKVNLFKNRSPRLHNYRIAMGVASSDEVI